MSDFGIFGLEFENNILIFEMTTLVIAKFRKKQKCLNFGSKILEDFCHVGQKFRRLLSYLKSAPWKFLIPKFCEETKT